MSNTGPYYEPILFISPLLTIVPRTGASFDDLTGITGLPTDDRCTCGTYDALEFIDISSNYQIDLPDPLGSDGHNLTLIIAYDKPAFLSVTKNGKRDECPLCRILFYNFTRNIDQWLPQPILTGLEAKFEEFWSVHSASEAVKEIYSKIVPSHRTWVIGSFSNNAGTYKPQVVPDLCDLSRLKSWVQNCTTQHARCIDEKLVVDGLRLIDCYTQTVCEAEPSSCWVALSYVWGFREPSEPSECVPEDPERLSCAPKTVKDAMTVATVLGYRYLWVDAYCIDQVHGSNKEDQINQMDKIYRGAELTIVATGSDKASGLSGISAARKTSHKLFRLKERDILFTGPDPYKSARKSKWWSRGWTFQEGYLSRRLLVFGEQQMTFYCNTSSWMESLGGPETVENPSDIDWNNWSANASLYKPEKDLSDDTRYRNHGLFIDLVQQYTERDLRFDSDALRAFAGIMHHLRRSDPPVYNFAGLPYIPWADPDAKEKLVSLALASNTIAIGGIPERRPTFPSWTWAGWKGSAYWHERFFLKNLEEYSCASHDVCFESCSPPGAMIGVRSNPSQNFLDGVCAIHLEAPLVPAEHLIFDALWSGPDAPDVMTQGIEHWCPVTSAKFLENLAEGIWSCLMLGYVRYQYVSDKGCSVFLLFVEWQDEFTAVKIGSANYLYVSLPAPMVDTLERRKVRLV